MGNTGKDIVYALRMLARNPGFTTVAVATLALGIGVNTAIFSVVDGVLLKPLPFRAPESVVMVWQKSATVPELGISELDLEDYKARTHVFEKLGGFTAPGLRSAVLTGAGAPVEIAPSFITQNYFSVLGTTPIIGRDFLPEEGRRGHDAVAILGYGLWQTRFGGSRDVLDRPITFNRQSLRVIGVMGPDVFPADADVFVPFTLANPEKPNPRNYHELHVAGRLFPGQSVAQAQREMGALSLDLARSYPATNAGIGANIVSLRDEITGKVREPILILLSAVGLVMLIACGNVANLLLVRADARQKEIAIRVAVGAGRGRIISQLTTECLVLSTAGALFGLLLAIISMPMIRGLGANRIARLQHVGIDTRVLLFTTAIAVFSGLLFGLIPALRYSSANLNRMLRVGGRTSRSDSRGLRSVLVAGEVALAMVVVVGASLLVRSVNQILDVPPGFRADHLLVVEIALPETHYKEADLYRFYRRLLPKIAAIPGVTSISTTSVLPLSTAVPQTRFAVQGAPLPAPGRYPVAALSAVDPQFFKTMGIPILRGRTFEREEMGNIDDEKCIVNATLARSFLAGQDPVGRTILTNIALSTPEPCHVVAVVGDTRIASLDKPPQPVLYFAAYVGHETLVVRTSNNPMAAASAIQREVTLADPEQPLGSVRSMDQVVRQSISRQSFSAVLLVIFSAIGLILAALGLYGIVSYSVAQRTQEIGVRMALGAQPSGVFGMIVLQGMMVTGIGLVIGILTAAGATRLMSSFLYGIGAADPFSYEVGCALMVTVSAVACFVPAYRATRIDPIQALRYE
jgi:putative ABC transport system permease protein